MRSGEHCEQNTLMWAVGHENMSLFLMSIYLYLDKYEGACATHVNNIHTTISACTHSISSL